MFNVKMCFMREGMELWTSFTSPKRLNTEFLSCAGDELENLPPIRILVKTKGLNCLSSQSPRHLENLGVLSFLILLNVEEHCCDIDGCSLLNTDDFELGIALSCLSFSASSIMIYCMSNHLFLRRHEIFTG